MAKNLKVLANQLKTNHGVLLITTFDTGIRPGSLLDVKRWNDTDRVGHVNEVLDADPPIEGPAPCMLADFKRTHELVVGAAVELLQPAANAKAEFQQAREAVASFDSPVTYTLSLTALEDALEQGGPTVWNKAAGQRLKLKNTRVVFQVIRGRLSFFFRGQGSAGVDLKSTKLKNLGTAGLAAGWRWRNEATIESKEELVIGVQSARYVTKKERFDTES